MFGKAYRGSPFWLNLQPSTLKPLAFLSATRSVDFLPRSPRTKVSVELNGLPRHPNTKPDCCRGEREIWAWEWEEIKCLWGCPGLLEAALLQQCNTKAMGSALTHCCLCPAAGQSWAVRAHAQGTYLPRKYNMQRLCKDEMSRRNRRLLI